jgi:hypothetical protein
MNRTRTLVGAVALALATAGLVSSLGSPTVANPAFQLSGTVTSPDKPAHGHAWIEGVITDQATNKAVGDGDVVVEAYPAGVSDGDLVASSLLYASPDGSTDHGFYRLWGLEPGSYRIKFISRDGAFQDAITMVTVENREILPLDVMLKRMHATATRAALGHNVIATGEKGKVTVTVAGSRKPVGDVEIRSGRKVVGDDAIRASDKGKVTVTLNRLGAGSYDLKAYFLGSKAFTESTSKAVTLTVKKPKRHH